jgi:hypothetical protein
VVGSVWAGDVRRNNVAASSLLASFVSKDTTGKPQAQRRHCRLLLSGMNASEVELDESLLQRILYHYK